MADIHPFNTKIPLSTEERATYDAIDARLKQLSPKIEIEDYISQEFSPLKSGVFDSEDFLLKNTFSSLESHKSTLDGIYFVTHKTNELSDALYKARDVKGKLAFASMKEDPNHWALQKSFGVTPGTGWREIWRAKEDRYSKLRNSGLLNPEFKMRFGSAGVPFNFSALHCAVDKAPEKSNIHIDDAGFMLAVPRGFSVTADAYQHIMDELLFKTILRDLLVDNIDHKGLARVVGEVFRRVSIRFPNAFNNYAGVSKTVKSFSAPTSFGGALRGMAEGTLNLIKPIGMTVEVYKNDDLLVQANYKKVNNQVSLTLTVGGRF
jgi:hypothetical protein